MKEKDIKIIYIKKLEQIKKYNEAYFDKSNPLITDSEYDKLKTEILNLEDKYKYLTKLRSSDSNVGFKPSKSFRKISKSRFLF